MATKSKFFRVFVEGNTTDGRVIQRSWIEQIARTYSPTKYSARVWMEHIRSLLPDSPFRAYGDVTAVKAEEVEIDGEKKLALFAQIDPTADLVKLNKARQKIFTSAEIDPDFAKSGEVYLVGLGVTDSPASLGTEVLSFAAQNPDASPFKARKLSPTNLFTAAVEVELEFEPDTETDPGPSLYARVKELLGRKSSTDDKHFADIAQAVEAIAQNSTELSERVSADLANFTAQIATALSDAAAAKAQLADVTTQLAALADKIDHTADPTHRPRPAATGGNGAVVTDC